MDKFDTGVDVDMCDFKYRTEDIKKAVLKLKNSQIKRMQETLLKPFYMTGFNWLDEEQTRVSSWKTNYRTMANYGISFVDPRRCIVTMKSVDDTPVMIQKSIPNKFLRIVFLVIFIIIFLAIWN